ncbi:hypothetical protein SAMN05444486_1011172 [Lentibacter algarum]|uniref:Uncharacterized protein n=1 Tax=Lentibacter algarum TaxID=576131 RepID=A0A1H3IN20_9RHOB|nr:hypothetical protein SAMN05444486_1011172 [Lentibacter algarum]
MKKQDKLLRITGGVAAGIPGARGLETAGLQA